MSFSFRSFQNFLFYSLLTVLSFFALHASDDEITKSRILYLLKTGKEELAFSLYHDYHDKKGVHDAELLEQIAVLLIEQGFYSENQEANVLALFGAGISMNEKMLDILKLGIKSPSPEIQLISLNFLSRLHHEESYLAINRALGSNYLGIRLEAAFRLAAEKNPKITAQIESLMCKLPLKLLPLFPQFFGLIGTQDAMKMLEKLLNQPDEKVRAAAIKSAADYERDDLLPAIRLLATHSNVLEQEASCYAFLKMKDEASIPRLKELSSSSQPSVRLIALAALHHLGDKTAQKEIEEMAKNLNLYAIFLLSEIKGSEDLLQTLSSHGQLNVRINALFSLVKLKNESAYPGVMEILMRDKRDLAFLEMSSIGGALKYLKAVPSASQNEQEDGLLHESTLHFREEVLTLCLQFPEREFLKIAKSLFDNNQNELVPLLVLMLENIASDDAIALLKLGHQKAGAPLIRNYCNLSLFRLGEEGSYEENLKQFILQEYKADLIQFRPLLPFEMRKTNSNYQLTPHDTSRLLVEAFEAIACRQDKAGINLLLYAICHGNQKNKYALAGLLMHAAR